MRYFKLPKCHIAFNAKVGSSTLACGIVKQYYPEELKKALDDHERIWSRFSQNFKDSLPESFQKMLKNEKLDSIAFWQNICPYSKDPDTVVLLPIRDPIVRFASTVAYLEIAPEKAIKALENDENVVLEKISINLRKNTHFLTQSCLIKPITKLYLFPDELEKLCKDAELNWPMEKVNEGKFEKPKLSEDIIKRVKSYYSEDVKLHKTLK